MPELRLVAVGFVVLLCVNGICQEELNSIPAVLTAVERFWGVADTVATVGQLFQYHIPSDAFRGRVVKYQITSAGRSTLPSWLHVKSSTSLLEGVPLDDDVGQNYISVVAYGEGNDTAKDVFFIDVLPASHEAKIPLRMLTDSNHHCKKSDTTWRLVISIDSNIATLSSVSRGELLIKISDYLKVAQDELQLLVRSDQNTLDDTAIRAGPGNANIHQKPDSVLVWKISCEALTPSIEETLSKLQTDARNGALSQILGVPIIGWHLTKHLLTPSLRVKRQLRSDYSTPVSALMPTKAAIPDNYWETDEDNRFDESFDESEVQPPTRTIPTMASPTFHDASTQPAHHLHNHAHRTKTQGRHMHHHDMTVSPVANEYNRNNYYRKENYLYQTPVPTPDLHHTTVYLEPSRAYPEEVPIEPTDWPFHTSTPVFQLPVYTPDLVHPSVEEGFSTALPTDYHNEPPRIRNRIQKLAVVAGKYFEFHIPNNTFYDREQGFTPNLDLTFFNDEADETHDISWLQFDSKRQVIYGLPVQELINRWYFVVKATDNAGASVQEQVEISVEQHSKALLVNHEFVLEVEHNKTALPKILDRNVELLKRLRRLFGEDGDLTQSAITVLNYNMRTFTWTNDSLLGQSGCPIKAIESLHSLLVGRKEQATQRLLAALGPDFKVGNMQPRVTVNYLGHCSRYITTIAPQIPRINTAPKMPNPIDIIEATEGELFRYEIKHDTFYDDEQGDTYNLDVELKNENKGPLKKHYWVRYDSTLHILVGLPMKSDVGEHKLLLIAYDNQKLSVSDSLNIIVVPRPENRSSPIIEFSVELKFDYETFQSDLRHKLIVLDKLTKLYNDSDSRFIDVRNITAGSVVFTWTNNSLPQSSCPRDTITHLISFLMNESRVVTQNLTTAFAPEFSVSKASVMPYGVCLGEITPTSGIPGATTTTVKPKQATSDDDIYISTIVPALVIAAMLVIAAIVACILYRKKRKGKMSMEDSSTFVKRGAPVIFTHELEEKPDSAKTPMIMKEEKPPLPPPEYPRTSSGSSSPSTPPVHGHDHSRSSRHPKSPYHRPHQVSSLEQQQAQPAESSPLYQPPPPVTADRDNRMHWPKHALTYRMPPPYVPP